MLTVLTLLQLLFVRIKLLYEYDTTRLSLRDRCLRYVMAAATAASAALELDMCRSRYMFAIYFTTLLVCVQTKI